MRVNGADSVTTAVLIGNTPEVNENFYTYDVSKSDYKKELYNKIISKYNDVKSLEESYKVALNDYEVEKKNFDILEKKNELGMITDLDLKQAKASLAEKESELIKTQFDHMLLVDTLENTSLL